MGVMNEENWGSRKAVISDLSPIATFIASLYTTPVNLQKLDEAFRVVLKKAQEECAWMYETPPRIPTSFLGPLAMSIILWSDVFICHCGAGSFSGTQLLTKDRLS